MKVTKVNGIEFPDILISAPVTSKWRTITSILVETDTEGDILGLFTNVEQLKEVFVGAVLDIAGQLMTDYASWFNRAGSDWIKVAIYIDCIDLANYIISALEMPVNQGALKEYLLSQPLTPSKGTENDDNVNLINGSFCYSPPKVTREQFRTALVMRTFRSTTSRDLIIVLGRIMSKRAENVQKIGLTEEDMTKIYDYIMRQSLKRKHEFGGLPIPYAVRLVNSVASKCNRSPLVA